MGGSSQKKSDVRGRSLRVSSKIEPQITKYYLRVSRRYQFVCVLAVLALLVYLIVIFSLFGSYVTYDNLQYLLRDFDSMTASGESSFSQIKYDRQSEQTFAVFKNGLAAAGKDSFVLFDSSGLPLCEDSLNCNDPVLVPSDKYLLLYDMGGTTYSIYNSLTRVVSRQTEHKIVGGDMSDVGAFLLTTRSNETKYVVELYNSALKHVMSIYKDNYVMDAALSPNGKTVVVCSAVPSDTDFDCEIALYEAGNTEIVRKITLAHATPLSVRFHKNGFTLLCDVGLYFYDENGEALNTFLFSGMTLEYADMSDEVVVLTGSENALGSENRVLAFLQDGSLLYDDLIKGRVGGVCAPASGKGSAVAYLLTPEKIVRLTKTEENGETTYRTEEESVREKDVVAIRAVGDGIVVCSSTGAYYLFK